MATRGVQTGRAFLAGVVGAALGSLVEIVAQAAGVPANIEMLLGTMLGGAPGALRWTVGLLLLLAGGGVLALGYAAMFEYWGRAGWLAGLALGIPQAIALGALLGLAPLVHPLVPGVLPAPGSFMSGFGTAGVALHVTTQLLFGALVGAMYEAVMAERRAQAQHRSDTPEVPRSRRAS
jgi:hypothetical protein